MKKALFTVFLLSLLTLLSLHEFWLQPHKFIYDRGEEINISFLTGQNFDGENWNGDSLRIRSLVYYYGGVKDDIPKKLFPGKGAFFFAAGAVSAARYWCIQEWPSMIER